MVQIREIEEKDRQFVEQALKTLWGSDQIVYSGNVFDASSLPGFLAEENGRVIGLITYKIDNNVCQIISINALIPGKGIGSALLKKVEEKAKEERCSHILVITTNDNLQALEFYQKREFVVKKIKKGAVALSRKIKPEIPLIGENGIPLEDEIELQLSLSS